MVVVASVALYAQSRTLHHQAEVPAAGDKSSATLSVEDIQSNYSVLVVNLAISPGSALLDPQTQHLNEDLSLWVRSAATPTRRTWTKGMLPGVFPVPLTIAGEIERWPFDHYHSGPVEVELLHGGEGGAAERLPVTFVDHLPGWEVAASNGGGLGPYRVTLQRSLSAAAFGIVIVGVRGDALRGGTAAKRTSRFATVRRLDRYHNRALGARRVGDLDAALHRLLVAASETRGRCAGESGSVTIE